PADVGGDEVDAGDVEPDNAGGVDGPDGDVGVDAVGDIGRGAARGQVAIPPDQDALPGRRHRVGVEALLGQDAEADGVQLDEAQRGGVPVAAARVLVDLLDEPPDCRDAVADDVGRLAPRPRDGPAADPAQP